MNSATNWNFPVVIVLLLLKIFAYQITCASATAIDNDLILTYSQKVTLDKFKERMNSKLPHQYMKTDFYLMRWLKAKNFNIEQAEQMLNQDLKWRRDNKMDSILQEDSYFIREKFPYFIDTVAKNGEPILSINFGEWNVREAAMSGQMPQLIRQFYRSMEAASTLVRKMQSEGKRVAKFYFLINMDRYNIITHGCLSCMPLYLTITEASQNHYSGLTRNTIFINTPPAFGMILSAIRPAMSAKTRKFLKIYGQDKRMWKGELLKIIDENQLSADYGGTFVRQQQE